jgi:hypothetical protein
MRLTLFLACVCLACPVVFADSADDLQKENQQLKDRVKELEKRLADAKQKLRQYEFVIPDVRTDPFGQTRVVPHLQIPRIVPIPPQLPATPALPEQSMPKNWKEREINGMKFYIVPLDSHGK